MKNNKKHIIYIAAIIFMLAIPFLGMSFWATNETTEKTELAKWPVFKDGNGWNLNYLQDMGTYFEDHFAFRQQLVTVNAMIRAKVFRVSATDQVVLGSDGWMYFEGSMDDYMGNDLLSQRELNDIVHNLSMIRNYVEQNGSRFILTIIPNKNSLYPEHMPDRYIKSEESNMSNLVPMLQAAGIDYADISGAIAADETCLYYQRDTHWNTLGALKGYQVLMEHMKSEYETYLNVPYHLAYNHQGDLDAMLYPSAITLEADYVYDKDFEYTYMNEVEDNMTSWIETENKSAQGTLLMYRDSFGEALLPFMAEAFGQAWFSRLVPYNVSQITKYRPDYVVIERVERKIAAFATEVPIMPCPETENYFGVSVDTNSIMVRGENGSFVQISGLVDEAYMQDDSQIFLSVRNEDTGETKTYQAFYTLTLHGNGNGYHVYIPKQVFPENVHMNLIVKNGNEINIVKEQ